MSVFENLRWRKFPVTSDGFVCLVDLMGDDSSVVQAARVSYGKDQRFLRDGDPENSADDETRIAAAHKDDRKLLRYLMRHRHSTPFEMAEIKFLIRCPMDCWRQWIRHRTANVNEYSTRYAKAIDSAQETPPGEWRLQAESNKQGSRDGALEWPKGYTLWPLAEDGELLLRGVLHNEHDVSTHVGWAVVYFEAEDGPPEEMAVYPNLKYAQITPGFYLSTIEDEGLKDARKVYEERLKFNVAREQARKDLPLATYTEAYWKIDLHNLLHFLGLRMDSHAQKEIRDYATVIGDQIVKPLFPCVWEAFEDYRLNAMMLSRLDICAVHYALKGMVIDPLFTDNRERDESVAKLKRLGVWPDSTPAEQIGKAK